ncbi:hypothetical protein ACOME3_005713 [Neoechinorhynchus agilis]
MVEFFKSTFNSIIQQADAISHELSRKRCGSDASTSTRDNERLQPGSQHSIEKYKIVIGNVIGDGAFGVDSNVHVAREKDRINMVEREIKFWKKASSDCPHIVQFIHGSQVPNKDEYWLISELCDGGRLGDALNHTKTEPSDHVAIFTHMVKAVNHLHHEISPPITHRDLKLENFLITYRPGPSDKRCFVVLCDFGSCTDDVALVPSVEWTHLYRSMVEDELTQCTTPQYRPPEVLDTYSGYLIGPPMDIWALGCLLYRLAVGKHPFEDADAKLKIINGHYKLPKCSGQKARIFAVIARLLVTDPAQRPTANQLLVDIISRLQGFNANLDCFLKLDKLTTTAAAAAAANSPTYPQSQSSQPTTSWISSATKIVSKMWQQTPKIDSRSTYKVSGRVHLLICPTTNEVGLFKAGSSLNIQRLNRMCGEIRNFLTQNPSQYPAIIHSASFKVGVVAVD